MLYYTGVGSRDTPPKVLQFMTQIAAELSVDGYILRSGGARGADLAFEQGTVLKQIFYAKDATPAAMQIAGLLHPAWNRCSVFAKRLHGRNSLQVLGPILDNPSEFLICWTPDGCIDHVGRAFRTGGTGTAISIAFTYGIPVHNLALSSHMDQWVTWLEQHKGV